MSGLFWFLPLRPYALYLTIKNLSYILWCITPQVKRSSNGVLLERSDPMASLAPEQLKGDGG